jgi:hypothetical protein
LRLGFGIPPRRVRTLLALLFGSSALLMSGCSGDPAGPPSSQPVVVSGATGLTTVRAENRDIYETARLEGVVESYPAVPVMAIDSGAFSLRRGMANGATVNEGETLGSIERCLVPADPVTPGSTAPPCPSVKRTTVVAPAAGVVSGLAEREVAAGSEIGSVKPAGLHIRLTVEDPAVLYGFATPPTTARAELIGGPSGFTVAYEGRAYSESAGRVNIFTTLPAEINAFEGLHAVVVFVTALKQQVPTLPVSAVRGRDGKGMVVGVDGSGHKSVIEITVGYSDGAYVEVGELDPTTDVLLYPLESDFSG